MKVVDDADTAHKVLIQDNWRNEWNRGVQVPVDECRRPTASTATQTYRKLDNTDLGDSPTAKVPNEGLKQFVCAQIARYIHFRPTSYVRYSSTSSGSSCDATYSLDAADWEWLVRRNCDPHNSHMPAIEPPVFEQCITTFEHDCARNLDMALRRPIAANAATGHSLNQSASRSRHEDDSSCCDVCFSVCPTAE